MEYLSGKTIVVTGATSGIGLAIAGELARHGTHVIGIGRSRERCEAAERLLGSTNPEIPPKFFTADLSLQSEVRKAAEEIREILLRSGREWLDGLVNNAGTFAYWLTLTPEGFETQWAVNHLAPFLLTHELRPLLEAAPESRVVTVSSASHYAGRLNWEDIQLRHRYNGLRAYEQTKLANVLFTAELNRRLGEGSPLRAFAADPGLVKTDIGLKGTPGLVRWFWGIRRSRGVTPEVSAKGIVYLLGEPSLQSRSEIYWKQGTAKTPSRFSQDTEAARRLWAISERMCGVRNGDGA
jgi:NAD(P)-dependent dehydrogenase (short-subunit alcohol dehydrogenase family)